MSNLAVIGAPPMFGQQCITIAQIKVTTTLCSLFIHILGCLFLLFQVVVLFIICVVALLFLYMLFLLCLDPLMTHRPIAYTEQRNEEINLVIATSECFVLAYDNATNYTILPRLCMKRLSIPLTFVSLHARVNANPRIGGKMASKCFFVGSSFHILSGNVPTILCVGVESSKMIS